MVDERNRAKKAENLPLNPKFLIKQAYDRITTNRTSNCW
jgi:hypothetical protein